MLCARMWICWGFLPKLIPVFQSSVFHVVAQIQGYHLICMWGRLVKFHGGGVVLKTILCARLWICWVFVPGLIPVFQSSVSPSNWEGFGLVGCHVVAQIQGYHLICLWDSLVKFQGGGVVPKTMLCVRLWICWVFVPGLIPVFQSSVCPSNWGSFVSRWV